MEKNIYVYVFESLCCIAKINIALQINFNKTNLKQQQMLSTGNIFKYLPAGYFYFFNLKLIYI